MCREFACWRTTTIWGESGAPVPHERGVGGSQAQSCALCLLSSRCTKHRGQLQTRASNSCSQCSAEGGKSTNCHTLRNIQSKQPASQLAVTSSRAAKLGLSRKRTNESERSVAGTKPASRSAASRRRRLGRRRSRNCTRQQAGSSTNIFAATTRTRRNANFNVRIIEIDNSHSSFAH